MLTSSKQSNFTFNCLKKDITGSYCCVFKARQYINVNTNMFINGLNKPYMYLCSLLGSSEI